MSFINSEDNMRALENVECFVLDMDGTFNLGMEIIPRGLWTFTTRRQKAANA